MRFCNKYLLILLLAFVSSSVFADNEAGNDSVPRYSVGASMGLSTLLGREDAGVDLVKKHSAQFYTVYFNSQSLPSDSNVYDAAWRFPSIEAGVLVADFSHVRLSRIYPTQHYLSGMGYEIAAYASFRRDLLRNSRFRLGYALCNGIAYSTRPYDKYTNVDNEFTGSRLSVYFGLELYGNYRFGSGVEAGLSFEFRHFSNAALDRPNKGANTVGVSAKVSVPMRCAESQRRNADSASDDDTKTSSASTRRSNEIPRGFYLDVNGVWGGKALLDEWLYYYYSAPKDDPDYQTSHFRIRSSWGVSVAPMWRYSTRYASGIGLDYSYVTYADRIHQMDLMRGIDGYETSSHVLGVSLRHEAFYKQVSASMSLGFYLHRKMGYVAKIDEKPYYETIGVRWYPSFMHGKAYVGYDVKAHLLKADCMQIRFGVHLWR